MSSIQRTSATLDVPVGVCFSPANVLCRRFPIPYLVYVTSRHTHKSDQCLPSTKTSHTALVSRYLFVCTRCYCYPAKTCTPIPQNLETHLPTSQTLTAYTTQRPIANHWNTENPNFTPWVDPRNAAVTLAPAMLSTMVPDTIHDRMPFSQTAN